MKTWRKKFTATLSILTLMLVMTITGCKDEEVIPPGQTVYNLNVKDSLGVSGTVTFTETSTSETTVEIVLTGANTETHPAHIHLNSALEGGGIEVTFEPVNAAGTSTTIVTQLDNGAAVTYAQLIEFNGYVNVHQSMDSLHIILAQGDIGGNALTANQVSYALATVNSSGVSGTALFQQRKNGNTIITLSVTGTLASGTHPAHIHLGSVATVGGGPIVVTLSDVNGATGKSYTNVKTLDNATSITYDNLLAYDGYINVHESHANLGSILCQGNIGSN